MTDAQITTFLQEMDAQGPAVVHRISTAVGDLACTPNTVNDLVEALHTGKSVTITSKVNGTPQTASFNASGSHLGYGEAYVALALAAEELRNAGITSCAAPEQWHAVLMGGPLSSSVSSTSAHTVASAGTSVTVPGIVALHARGQGWGQIAQSNKLQLGQIVSASSSTGTPNLTPTGRSSAEMNQGHNVQTTKPETNRGQDKEKGRDQDKDKDHDNVPRAANAGNPSPPDR